MRRIVSKKKINKSKSILAPRKHLYKGVVFLLFFSFAIVFIFGDHGLLKLYNIKNERKIIQKKIAQLREEKEILKEYLGESLDTSLFEVVDLGTNSKESVDYPDFAHKLTNEILNNKESSGILICGSGVGMSISANRNPKIRAGLVHTAELAKLIRQHNDANVLVLPGRFIDIQEAIKCVENFLNTEFESGRHKQRIDKI